MKHSLFLFGASLLSVANASLFVVMLPVLYLGHILVPDIRRRDSLRDTFERFAFDADNRNRRMAVYAV